MRILPRILAVLARMPLAVVMATSGRVTPGGAVPADSYTAPLLPFAETAARCALLVSHGGSSSFYPALAAGTPVLGIPSNADQQISAQILAESGAGLALRSDEASERSLAAAIDRLLSDNSFKQAAVGWARISARTDSRALLDRFLHQTLGKA